jgi:DnaJ family protein A protein 5
LHPDRNYGNVDEATRLFAEIQSAYEVLADPQERAWYDSHKDAFLGTTTTSDGSSEGAYNIRITTAEEVLKVFSKFSPRMEFSDSPSGFFGGLQEQFAQLALEERAACQWENQDIVEYPSFGSASDDFETVVRPFYSVWTGFSTKKSFAWKDAHRLSEAPDRRVRRLMEKENRRLRDEGIRTFNDAVRSLVAFIKKRDPRWKINAQNEAQRQEALRQSVAAQAARSRAMNNAKMRDHVLPEWARSEELVVSDDDEESSESEVESFECVACNKSFKSEKQFEAHEKSKKHVKAVKQLTREMRLQDVQLDLDQPAVERDASDLDTLDDDDIPAEDVESVRTPSPVGETETSTDETGEPPFVQSQETTPSELDKDTKESNLATPDQELDSSDSGGDEDYASRETVETRLHPDFGSAQDQDPVTPLNEQLSSVVLEEEAEEQPRAPALGKAKQKKAKKAAREVGDQSQSGLMCSGCNANFPSKTKLFAHLQKNPSHAQLKTTTKGRRR